MGASGSSDAGGDSGSPRSSPKASPQKFATVGEAVCYANGSLAAQSSAEPPEGETADAAVCTLAPNLAEAYGQGYKDAYEYQQKNG